MCYQDHNTDIHNYGRCEWCSGTVVNTGYRPKTDLYDKVLAYLSAK